MCPPTPEIYTLSLHDALPISLRRHLAATTSHIAAPVDVEVRRSGAGGAQACVGHQRRPERQRRARARAAAHRCVSQRSEEHTSELQSRRDLVCRLLLEKKKER